MPSSVNLHVQTETKTECVVLVPACLYVLLWKCRWAFFCKWQCPPGQVHVHIHFHEPKSTCLDEGLSFLHAYIGMNLSVLSASTLECTPLLSWECDCVPVWYVRAKQTRECSKVSWVNFGPLGYTLEAGQSSRHCLLSPFLQWLVWQIMFTRSSVQLRDQENCISEKDCLSCVPWL